MQNNINKMKNTKFLKSNEIIDVNEIIIEQMV